MRKLTALYLKHVWLQEGFIPYLKTVYLKYIPSQIKNMI